MVGVALATFAALTWLTYEKLAELAKQQTSIAERHVGLTNALESHSTLILLIEAKRGLRPGAADNQPIRTVWWDPTVEKAHFFGSKPGVVKKHRDEIDLDEIRLNIPPSFRQGNEKL